MTSEKTKQTDQYEILVIEDNPSQRAALERLLTNAGYVVKTTDSAEKALSFVGEGIDCVVAGVISGDISRLDLIKHWRNYFPHTPLPVIHETESVKSLIETINTGTFDDLENVTDAKQMLSRLMDLVHACQKDQKPAVPDLADGTRDHIIGQSQPMRDVFDLIARSSQAFSTVLILGESGTGKDLVAQAIHRNSPRNAGPFIALNCAAMPETLVESELFGYDKGAFSGAIGPRVGRFEAASGGTLFIDEIGDCALSLQAKLLRILENRIVTPLGGHREIKVNTRVIAATSRDLPIMVSKGLFREDLYYRLNIITIRVPPLRARLDDIPLLVRHFIEHVNLRNITTPITSISKPALEALQRYHWPGNVRELVNVIERAMVLADRDNTVLSLKDLPSAIQEASLEASRALAIAPTRGGLQPAVPPTMISSSVSTDEDAPLLTLAELEQLAIQGAMQRYRNNKTRAAHAIGISVRTLQRKLGRQEVPSLVLFRADVSLGSDSQPPNSTP